jgi:hypothetical protein
LIELNPDKLNLTKQDLLNFLDACLIEWKKNKVANFKYILAMEIMRAQVKITSESVLKKIWGKIIQWFYDLNYQNAKADKNDKFFETIRKLDND